MQRRRSGRSPLNDPPRVKEIHRRTVATYQFGGYRFAKLGLLWEADRLVGIMPLQQRMLRCFCRQPRELISKAALIDQL